MLGFGALGQFALGQYENFLASEAVIATEAQTGVSGGGTKKPRRVQYDLSEGFTGKLVPMEDETAAVNQAPLAAPSVPAAPSVNVAELLRLLIADELAAIAAQNAALWAERMRLDNEEDEDFLLILS